MLSISANCAAVEEKILTKRYSKEVLKNIVAHHQSDDGATREEAVRIVFDKYVCELVGYSFPERTVAPDVEDQQQTQNYEA
jgi:hypothetical protein